MADFPGIECGARGTNDGFRRNATDDEAVPAQEIFLDQGYLRTETGGPCRRHQPGRPGTNDDQIVAGRRDGVLPIERMATRHEARVVYVRWLDQNSLRGRIHIPSGAGPVSLPVIFFANAFLASRVTNTVTTTVASRPT